MLAGFPGIDQVGVTDIEVKADARIIVAFYTGPAELDETALRDYVQDRLAGYKRPRAYVHLPALPVGANGKLLRRALKAEFGGAAVMNETKVKLDILSDPICPWCYIGKARLDAALAAEPDHPFAIEWHPFQLNPDMPEGGMDRREYLETKFGGREGAVRAYAPVIEQAEAAGLRIDFEAMQRTPNTLDAHRLIHWAGIEGRQSQAVDALFAAYFVEGRDIGDREVLADIADSIGMDASVVRKLLGSEADKDDIRARDAHSRKMGVNSVPTFIVAGKHAVPGAQPTELWRRVIGEIRDQIKG